MKYLCAKASFSYFSCCIPEQRQIGFHPGKWLGNSTGENRVNGRVRAYWFWPFTITQQKSWASIWSTQRKTPPSMTVLSIHRIFLFIFRASHLNIIGHPRMTRDLGKVPKVFSQTKRNSEGKIQRKIEKCKNNSLKILHPEKNPNTF